MNQHITISSAYGGEISQFSISIPRTDMILMGYFMKGKLRTISRILSYIIRPSTGFMYPKGIPILKREMLLGIHLESISNISLLGTFRVSVGGLGDAL